MAEKDKVILAIDHGTSGAKTALVTVHGKVLDWAFKETPIYFMEERAVEQDPDEWWDAILETSKKLIDKGTVQVEDIVGICNTSLWSTVVPLDKDGNHLMRAMSWMDSRGEPQTKKVFGGFPQVSGYNIGKILKWLKVTGAGPSLAGVDTVSHIMWIREKRPDIYEKTYKFLEPQDWVNMKFTGKYAASFSSSMLCWVSDIRDIHNVKYSDDLCKITKIDKEKLGELKQSIEVLGPITNEISDELGLEKDTKVVMGAPDVFAAAIGAGTVENYQAHACLGTSTWLMLHVPQKGTDIDHQFGAIPSALPGKYILTNEQHTAGGALSYLRDNVLYHKDELLQEAEVPDVYKIFDKIVEGVEPGSKNLIFTPWLHGERAPVSDPFIRGGLFNLSLDHNREHVIRAVFEGIAYNMRWLHMYIEKFKTVNRRVDNIHLIGGGANSNIWCQVIADVMQRTMLQMKDPIQANSRGAALIGSLGLGYIKEEEIPKCVEVANVYKPNPELKPVYDKLFKEYVNIYNGMKKICKRLNSTP
ncbi:MAG: FGGY-family carbohydrate kinase [Candidatus Hodarchaeota archaeon]